MICVYAGSFHSFSRNVGNSVLNDGPHQEKSSEVIIPVLEHGKLHVGRGRFSVLKIMIKIAISQGPH